MSVSRCKWAKSDLDKIYHDQEWGKPSHDDAYLFELLILEGFQAGLSWATILQRREAMRGKLDQFDWLKIKDYDQKKLDALQSDPIMIRNRLKIASLKKNALAFEKVRAEFGSFDTYIWSFSNGKQIVNNWTDESQVPAKTPLSEEISKDLKKRGFSFVGPVIVYAYLQAIGVVNDHVRHCDFK